MPNLLQRDRQFRRPPQEWLRTRCWHVSPDVERQSAGCLPTCYAMTDPTGPPCVTEGRGRFGGGRVGNVSNRDLHPPLVDRYRKTLLVSITMDLSRVVSFWDNINLRARGRQDSLQEETRHRSRISSQSVVHNA